MSLRCLFCILFSYVLTETSYQKDIWEDCKDFWYDFQIYHGSDFLAFYMGRKTHLQPIHPFTKVFLWLLKMFCWWWRQIRNNESLWEISILVVCIIIHQFLFWYKSKHCSKYFNNVWKINSKFQNDENKISPL